MSIGRRPDPATGAPPSAPASPEAQAPAHDTMRRLQIGIAGVLTGAVAGVLAYLVVYRPFERDGSPSFVILVASLGLFIVLENAIGVVFGTDTKVVPSPPGAVFPWGPLVITGAQLAQVAALVLCGLALWLYLTRTRMGKAVNTTIFVKNGSCLAGLGGGVLIVPILSVGFGLDIRLAVGASIVSVIATSSGAGAALVRDRLTNVRIATLLQVATVGGAVGGALLAPHIPSRGLFFLFGAILLITTVPTLRKIKQDVPPGLVSDPLAIRMGLPGSFQDHTRGEVAYTVTNVPAGFGLMIVAGVVSGLLGIGSGALKVLAMDTAMRLPIKISTATSNFMIGVTAAASAGIYFWRGDVLPFVAAPIALGVLTGSMIGARYLVRARSATIRMIFVGLLIAVAIEMLLRGAGIA